MWSKPCKDSILLALNNEEYKIITMYDQSVLCTIINFNTEPYRHPKIYTFEDEKQAVFDILSTKYAGYSDMVEKGFSKKVWKSVKSYDDMTNVLTQYVNDTHLSIRSANYYFHKGQRFDEGLGYEPDIWATTETMKATLEGLGLDLKGIQFN